MRLKEYILVLLMVSFILFFPNGVNARVGVQCSSCHTMHNSQDGAAVVYELNDLKDGYDTIEAPNNYLLKSNCAGCHSSIDPDTIDDGTGSDDGGTPIVFSTSNFSNPLAGGNFSYVLDDDTYGHNVDFLIGPDGTLNAPPGGSALSSQLTCAGENGCHGDRSSGNNNYSGTKGAHHTDDTGGITVASIGLSYRFLDGIRGTEDNNWEQDNDNASHNEYKGSALMLGNDTISSLCAECHGNFHGSSNTNLSSPFKRHPTDMLLPSSGEYSDYQSYSMIAPVARPNPPLTPDTSSATVYPGTDIVMCLSCHRAHASPYYKILRWNIKGTKLLSATPDPDTDALYGCVVCHTSKD